MLISFTVENWMSFREPATLTMVASKEEQHSERVARIEKHKMGILPIAAVYGGNASGKTNLFKALNFAKTLIVRGTQPDSPINVETFRLDSVSTDVPSKFSFEILVGKTVYSFSFSVTRSSVLEEKLVEIRSASERVLYDRRDGRPNFHTSLGKDKFLEFAFQGTRDNQLFLTNSVSQKVDHFRPVFEWFRDRIVLIAPDTRFEPFEQFSDDDNPLYRAMNEILPQLDTGVAHLASENVPFEDIRLPKSLRTRLQEDLKKGRLVRILGDDRLFAVSNDGELTAKKLIAFHRRSDGTEVKFEFSEESDGTQRLIDLLPAFLDLSADGSSTIYVIDEIDRSLHTLLTRQLLESYLGSCSPSSRSQLLFTTHDALLMDQRLFRRDEIWVTERDVSGASKLFSFSEYKDVRKDKDIRKSYLQGRLGGIPRLLLGSSLVVPCASGAGQETE